jgi:hypothetical protein
MTQRTLAAQSGWRRGRVDLRLGAISDRGFMTAAQSPGKTWRAGSPALHTALSVSAAALPKGKSRQGG